MHQKPIFKNKKRALENPQCYDCGKKIKIENNEVKNGMLLLYEEKTEDLFLFKCEECYKKNPGISDYKECEVYSRIVGYLRPVQNYNPGKQQEYKERKEYIIKK